MALLSKQDIFNADDVEVKELYVEEWKGTVRIKALTARERDAFEASLVSGEGKKRKPDLVNIRAKLVGLCLVDANGARLFNDSEISLLGAKNSAAMDRVFTICQRLAGLSAEDVDELEKKSGGEASASSTLNSHSPSDSLTPTTSSTDSPVGN